jgi:SAM-dependent methyltransferase
LSASPSSEHWRRITALWRLLGPPLRPSPDDVAIVHSAAHAWRAAHPAAPLDALLLGVTPEIAALAWPDRTRLVAIDNSEAALAAIWPKGGSSTCAATARLGDWRELPLADASVDLAAGDGSFTLLSYPSDYRVVLRELHRVLRPDGRLVLRVFAPPEKSETVSDVADALWSRRITGLHAFKWRLAMAVQPRAERAVVLGDVWRAYQSICPDPTRLVEEIGWSRESLATVDVYRDSASVYSFPALDEIRPLFADTFTELSVHVPSYELGDRCPTLVLTRRS